VCVHTEGKPGISMAGRRNVEVGRSQEGRSALQNKWMKGSGEVEIPRLEEWFNVVHTMEVKSCKLRDSVKDMKNSYH